MFKDRGVPPVAHRDAEYVPPRMLAGSDPNIFHFVLTGKFPDPAIQETPQQIQARKLARRPYSPEEVGEILTPWRRELLTNAGPAGVALLAFMETGDNSVFEVPGELSEK